MGAAQLFDHLAGVGVGLEQAHRIPQLGRRWREVHVHFAQGVVADTADIRHLDQLGIGKRLGGMAHAPQQGQAVPFQWPFQGVAPGATAVALKNRLVGRGVARVLDAPLLLRLLEELFVNLIALADIGLALQLMLPQRVRP